MKPNYILHDERYKKAKTACEPGWRNLEEVQENIEFIKEFLASKYVPKKGRFLALGCGAGNNVLWLAEKGYEVYGVDIAPTAIAWANEKAKEQKINADFQEGSVIDLKNYTDNFFDIVLDDACLHCILGEDRKLCLANVHRVLKPGGIFHVATMCGDPDHPGPAGKAAFATGKWFWDSQSRNLLILHKGKKIPYRYVGSVDDITTEIKTVGFEILSQKIVNTSNDDHLFLDAVKA